MLELFWRISVPHFAEHKLRTIVTVIGVGLGVAAIAGLQFTFQPLTHAIRDGVEQVSGRAVLRIANGDAGVPEELLNQVEHIAGVRAASASVQSFVPVAGHSGERLFVFGVDFLKDRKLRDYDFSALNPGEGAAALQMEDPLIFLAKADSVALTKDFAVQLGVKLGDRVEVQAPSGLRPLTIRAVLDGRRGPASAFGGRIAVMDIFAAQRLLQMSGRFTQIDISMMSGAQIDALEASLRHAVAGRASVQREEEQLKEIETALKLQQANMAASSNLALLLGIYLVFNTMVITIAQRWREIGILRSVGMRRRGVVELILAESITLGALGGLLGTPLGIIFAHVSMHIMLPALGGTYATMTPPPIELEAGPIITALVAGIVTAVLAGLIPAIQATAIHPLEAIRRSRIKKEGRRPYAIAAVVGVIFVVVATLVIVVNKPSGGEIDMGRMMLAISICFVGILLVTPFLMRSIVRKAELVTAPAAGSLGVISCRSMANNLSRVSLTATAFVASMILAVLIGCLARTLHAVMDRGMSKMLSGADLVVMSGTQSIGQGLRMPESLAPEIAQLDGVRIAAGGQGTVVQIGSNSFSVLPMDFSSTAPSPEGVQYVEGSAATAIPKVEYGNGVLLDDVGAVRLHAHLGTRITLNTPGGTLELETVGVIERASANGGMLLSMSLYRRYWRDHTVNMIAVWLKPGANPDTIADAIRRKWGATYELFVMRADSFRKAQHEVVDRGVVLMMPIVFIAAMIALLGLMNSLLASVIDRVREIALIRAAGGTAGQVARMVTIEALTMGLIAGVLSLPLGIGFFYFDVLVNRTVDVGVPFTLPSLPFALAIIVAAALMAALAGYFPARNAARIRITEAVRTE